MGVALVGGAVEGGVWDGTGDVLLLVVVTVTGLEDDDEAEMRGGGGKTRAGLVVLVVGGVVEDGEGRGGACWITDALTVVAGAPVAD